MLGFILSHDLLIEIPILYIIIFVFVFFLFIFVNIEYEFKSDQNIKWTLLIVIILVEKKMNQLLKFKSLVSKKMRLNALKYIKLTLLFVINGSVHLDIIWIFKYLFRCNTIHIHRVFLNRINTNIYVHSNTYKFDYRITCVCFMSQHLGKF